MLTDAQLERLRDVIQDCNLNFLLGSGLSAPYLRTLGNIEILLTEVEKSSLAENQKQIVRCSLYKLYFDHVMAKNLEILASDETAKEVRGAYNRFLQTLNSILVRRRSTLLGKEVNPRVRPHEQRAFCRRIRSRRVSRGECSLSPRLEARGTHPRPSIGLRWKVPRVALSTERIGKELDGERN